MSNAPVVGAPPKKASWSWVIWVAIAIGACIPILGIFAALAIYGVRKYIANAKQAEGQMMVGELAKGIARCAPTRATGGTAVLPETSTPVPAMLSSISGRKYMSATSDWTGDAYACAGLAMRDPQYFQYQWEKLSDTQGRAIGRADLEGDGVAEVEFEASVTCSGAQCTAGPVNRK